jgi:hypothetical protein
MKNITVERSLPTPEAIDALDKVLRDSLGNRTTGLSARTGGKTVTIHLTEEATAEDDNTARQIVLTHDFNKRTPEQEARAECKRLREAARLRAQDSKATKDEIIEYLLLQVAYLSEQIPV